MTDELPTISAGGDTDAAAERELIALTRSLPVWRRLARVAELNDACRAAALADLRRRYPSAPPSELRCRLAARLFPRADVLRAYGWDPEREGY